LSPRAQTDDELVLAGLRKAVREGRPGAANDLARHLRGTARDTTITRRRQAAINQKARVSTSRATSIVGPDLAPGMAERTLAHLLLDDDPDPAETAAVLAAHEQLRREQDAEPDHLDRSPAEISRQEAMNAQMREHQAWYRAWRDSVDNQQEA